MNSLAASAMLVADAQTKSANGAEGLLVFLFLAVAVYFLLRSMTKHLRKAQLMKMNEPAESAESSPDDPPPVVS